jgi:hypothetical protein
VELKSGKNFHVSRILETSKCEVRRFPPAADLAQKTARQFVAPGRFVVTVMAAIFGLKFARISPPLV